MIHIESQPGDLESQPGDLFIRNAGTVYTMNGDREVLHGVDIRVKAGIIKSITPSDNETSSEDTEGVRVVDATDMVVLSGSASTHTHFDQPGGVDVLKRRPVIEFVQTMCAFSDGLDEEAAYSLAKIAIAKALLSGVTTLVEDCYMYPHRRWNIFDAKVRAAKELGVRFYPVRGCLCVNEQGESIWPDSVLEDPDDVLAHIQEVVERYHDPSRGSLLRVGMGPCGYYSASRELFRQMADYAESWGEGEALALHTHALEFAHEDTECRKLFGQGVLEFLDAGGFLRPGSWLAHCIYAGPEDIARLAQTGTGVAHAPVCMTAKKRVARIKQMLVAGVNVGVGPDGLGGFSENMLLQVLFAARLQGMNPDLEGVSYLMGTEAAEIATIGGARAINRSNIGWIGPGQCADFAIVDVNRHLECAGFHNQLDAVYLSGLMGVDYTVVQGRVLVDRGELVTADGAGLAEIIRKHNEIAARIRLQAEEKLGRSLSVGWVRAFNT